MIDAIDLMTEAEVAAVLHKSPRTVKALRQGGKLAFLPGKPVLIPRQALADYLSRTVVTTRQRTRLRPLRKLPNTH